MNDVHRIFFGGTCAATRIQTRLQPLAISSTGGANPIYTGGRFVPAEFLVNGVMPRIPLMPQGLYSRAADRDNDGARDYSFTRRMSDIDMRGQRADRNTLRVLRGILSAKA